jgi:hypothetical protein
MEVPCAHIEASFDRLPLLCAEGFAYYLPAYLLCAVTNPQSETAHFAFYAVCPDKSAVEQPWMRERFAALSESQLRAIFQFQDFMIEQGCENPSPAVLERFRSRLRILASR